MTTPSRTKYPTRNAHFRQDCGMSPEKITPEMTEQDQRFHEWASTRSELYRYVGGLLAVESLESFKNKFCIKIGRT